MRMSARESDPGYENLNFNCYIYLDGVIIENCFTADEEMGVVYCYQTDGSGGFKITESGEDIEDIEDIELRGEVKIIIREQGGANQRRNGRAIIGLN